MRQQALRWLGIFFAYKAVVFALGFIGLILYSKIWPTSIGHFAILLHEWDAKHILRTAMYGYVQEDPNIQVLPVFPFVIRAFYFLIRDWNIASAVAAQFCSFFAFYYFYQLARMDLTEHESRVALVLFAIFPTAYFLSVPYMEVAFCAAVPATVYYLRRQSTLPAALAGFIAAASRIPGIVLMPAILIHLWFNRAKLTRTQKIAALAAAAGVGLGFHFYLFLNFYNYGEWWFILKHQQKWGVHLSWPFSGAFNAIRGWSGRSNEEKINLIIMPIAVTVLVCASLVWIARKRSILDFCYTLFTILLIISTDFWLSPPRFYLTLYPMFLVAAPWFAQREFRLPLYCLGSAGLFVIYWIRYLNASWAF